LFFGQPLFAMAWAARGSGACKGKLQGWIGLLLLCALAEQWLAAFTNPYRNALNERSARARTKLHASNADLPDKWKAGPAEVYSGVAQKALYLMKENPTLFDMTVDEELEKLQVDKEEEEKRKNEMEANPKEDTLVLRRRIEEVKMNDRVRAVTELLYLKVCRKFQQLQVPLIPALKEGGDVRFGNIDLKALTSDIYSQDALELVREHLFRIIASAKKPRKEKASKRQKKDPNAPKRAMPAYMIWLSENREAIKSENPGISIGEISKKAGEKWQQITDKSEWVKKAAQAKENYKIAMAKYLQEQKSEASTTPSKSSSASKSNPIKEALSKSSKPPKPTSTSPSKFKSKEFIESSEDSSSEDEKSKKSSKAANKSSDEEDEESEAQMTDEDESDSD